MAPQGGAATINGILYQLLGVIDRAARIALRIDRIAHDDVDGAQLVVEPSGGGGDLQMHFPSRIVIEQWKAKSSGTWSLKDVVEDVLPDLYLAVQLNKPGSTYRFVTEGRRGVWGEAQRLFQSLAAEVPADPLAALDDNIQRRFGRDLVVSERELFKNIAESLRSSRPSIGQEPLEQVYRKLWHLLSRFEFEGGLSQGDLTEGINTFLLQVVTNREDVESKRLQLCGLLLELGRSNSSLTPQELLDRVNLGGLPITQLAEIRSRIEAVVDAALRLKKFDPSQDVRAPIDWPRDRQILMIGGESGTGKSWALSAVAGAMRRAGDIVAVVDARQTARESWDEATGVVWRRILQRDGAPPLDALTDRINKFFPENRPRVVVLVDELNDALEARRLIEIAAYEPGVIVVLTLPLLVARQLSHEYQDRTHLVELGRFTLEELHQLLDRWGHDWVLVPADVRETLRLPVLAGLYARIVGDPQWHPTREYELYEKLWERICQVGAGGAARWIARGLLSELASGILSDDASYPWPQSRLRQNGMTGEHQSQLEACGCLVTNPPDGTIRIWHDRFLNWVVAEGLVEKRVAGRLSLEALCRVLEETQQPGRRYAGRSLGYVALDVLWIACQRLPVADVAALIKSLEGGHVEALYCHLLPTLGSRVVGPLIERLRLRRGSEFPTPLYFADSLVRIGHGEPQVVCERALALIGEQSSDLQEVGMRTLAGFPSRDALDLVWRLYQENEVAREASRGTEKAARFLFRREVVMAALRRCAELNLQWLATKLAISQLPKEIADLLHVLASARHADALSVWRRAKQGLPLDTINQWSLIRCIERFRDLDELDRLRSILSQPSVDAAFAYSAVVRLKPEMAIHEINHMHDSALIPTAWSWLPALALHDEDGLRDALLQRISADPPDSFFIAQVYMHGLETLNEATLNYLLDRLTELLEHPMLDSEGYSRTNPPVVHLLRLLAALWSPHHLRCFEARSESSLSDRLLQFAISRVSASATSNTVDSELEHARLILLKITGSAFASLVNHELGQFDRYSVQDGLDWCVVCPSDAIVDALWAFARRDAGAVDGDHRYLRQVALRRLAASGQHVEVVEYLLDIGECFQPDLIDALAEKSGVPGEQLERAVLSLDDPDEDRQLMAMWVIAVSQRADLVKHLHRKLEGGAAGSRAVLVAIRALGLIQANDERTADLLRNRLGDERHKEEAGELLLRIGTPTALHAVESILRVAVVNGFSRVDQSLAVRLWKNRTTSSTAAQLIWRDQTEHPRNYIFETGYIEAIGGVDDPTARGWLTERALTPPGSFGPKLTEAALRALSRLDPEAAFRGSWAECYRRIPSRVRVPMTRLFDLMREVDEDRCARLLLELASSVKPSLRDDIGRALRLAASNHLEVERLLLEMVQSPDIHVRRAAVDLAGWIPNAVSDDQLREIGLADSSPDVSMAAQRSYAQRATEKTVRQLMVEYRSAGPRQWSLLLGIIQLGDPMLLGNKQDSLWLGNLLPDDSGVMDFAKRHLDRRLEEVRRSAEDRDRREEGNT